MFQFSNAAHPSMHTLTSIYHKQQHRIASRIDSCIGVLHLFADDCCLPPNTIVCCLRELLQKLLAVGLPVVWLQMGHRNFQQVCTGAAILIVVAYGCFLPVLAFLTWFLSASALHSSCVRVMSQRSMPTAIFDCKTKLSFHAFCPSTALQQQIDFKGRSYAWPRNCCLSYRLARPYVR